MLYDFTLSTMAALHAASVCSLAAVVATGCFALYEMLTLGNGQTPRLKTDTAVTMLFTVSAAWMLVHIFTDPGVLENEADHMIRMSFAVFSCVRNAAICWFQVTAGRAACAQRKKLREWGAYRHGYTGTGHADAGGLARGHKLAR